MEETGIPAKKKKQQNTHKKNKPPIVSLVNLCHIQREASHNQDTNPRRPILTGDRRDRLSSTDFKP